MSSVNSVPAGVADLLGAFSTGSAPPVSSALSSKSVQSALDIASPGDLVQLSQQGIQLQQVDALFGSSGSSDGSASTDPLTALLQALANSSLFNQSATSGAQANGSPEPSTSGSTASSASAAAIAAASLAQQEAFALLGTNSSTGAGNSTISLLG